MSWLKNWIELRRERKLMQTIINLAVMEHRKQSETVLYRSSGCWGTDCDNCRCDLAPDTQ